MCPAESAGVRPAERGALSMKSQLSARAPWRNPSSPSVAEYLVQWFAGRQRCVPRPGWRMRCTCGATCSPISGESGCRTWLWPMSRRYIGGSWLKTGWSRRRCGVSTRRSPAPSMQRSGEGCWPATRPRMSNSPPVTPRMQVWTAAQLALFLHRHVMIGCTACSAASRCWACAGGSRRPALDRCRPDPSGAARRAADRGRRRPATSGHRSRPAAGAPSRSPASQPTRFRSQESRQPTNASSPARAGSRPGWCSPPLGDALIPARSPAGSNGSLPTADSPRFDCTTCATPLPRWVWTPGKPARGQPPPRALLDRDHRRRLLPHHPSHGPQLRRPPRQLITAQLRHPPRSVLTSPLSRFALRTLWPAPPCRGAGLSYRKRPHHVSFTLTTVLRAARAPLLTAVLEQVRQAWVAHVRLLRDNPAYAAAAPPSPPSSPARTTAGSDRRPGPAALGLFAANRGPQRP